jgi:hypothetical protein
MSMQPDLEPFLERLPWLADLGSERLGRLDRSDWYLPSDVALARLRPVSDALSVNLMFYRRDADAAPGGLCTAITAAALCRGHLERLAAAEGEDTGYVIVAYESPLRVRGEGPAHPVRSTFP